MAKKTQLLEPKTLTLTPHFPALSTDDNLSVGRRGGLKLNTVLPDYRDTEYCDIMLNVAVFKLKRGSQCTENRWM